ncbi:MAG: TatD family hydrolase [Clostridiales bacterium]|nr:TatD family hydrolase [Clostridiales bacterium]
MLFDTHAHYNDERFDPDRDEVLSSMEKNGVGLIMNACSSTAEIPGIIKLCEKYPFVYGAAGVHPQECADMTEEDIELIKQAAEHEKIKAVGEIGLDYYYDEPSRQLQRKWFERQVQLAKELKLPVIIHDRDAHGDTMDILRAADVRECGGVFHCYSGSVETAREILGWGMYIAFGGTLTFKNAKKVREAAQYVPIEQMVIETDAPYLAPEPQRGRRNDSRYMHFVACTIARIKGMDCDETERILTENGKRLFNIKD